MYLPKITSAKNFLEVRMQTSEYLVTDNQQADKNWRCVQKKRQFCDMETKLLHSLQQ